jgi:hypothetical protein
LPPYQSPSVLDSPEIGAAVADYNEVMHAEIRRPFGADIIQQLRAKTAER